MKNDPQEENDINLEPTEEARKEAFDETLDASEAPETALKKLREKLKTCVEEKQGYLDSLQRLKAETINARKRDEEAKKQFLQFANENLITELIPVLDSFETAFGNKVAWEKVDLNWRMGVQYIYSQMLKILEQHNIKVLDPLGGIYNPNLHEAVEMVDTKNKDEDGKIITVINKGYSLGERVIRPPKVKVGEFKA